MCLRIADNCAFRGLFRCLIVTGFCNFNCDLTVVALLKNFANAASGFFEVIRLLTFSLPLLPPLFLPLFFLLFRLLLRCSRAAPVPGAQPGLGAMRKAAARLRCSGLVAVTCLLCRIRPGNPAGIVARKILRGCLSGVFCMGARDPCVVRLPGRAGLDVYRIRFRT